MLAVRRHCGTIESEATERTASGLESCHRRPKYLPTDAFLSILCEMGYILDETSTKHYNLSRKALITTGAICHLVSRYFVVCPWSNVQLERYSLIEREKRQVPNVLLPCCDITLL